MYDTEIVWAYNNRGKSEYLFDKLNQYVFPIHRFET